MRTAWIIPKSVDTIFLLLIIVMVGFGFLIFSSASLGLLARGGASFNSVAFSQFTFGVIGGSIAFLITSSIHYRHYRKYAFYIFVIGVLATLTVFIPGLGMSHGGATRWLDLGFTTVQPSEFLKIAFVIYIATWLSGVQLHLRKFTHGLLPFVGITAIVGVVMLLQPDTDTFMIMAAAGMAMYLAAGAPWRDIVIMVISGILLLVLVAFMRPYVMDRFTTLFNPEADPQGSGYQIQQSLIAVGSGGLAGRGYGQSIQKFEYLPEPIGDSIFAVFAEEFGFIGCIVLIALYISITARGYRIASHAKDTFGSLLVVGFITILCTQAFLNIAAMLGVAPLSGLPLPFISHGGTALLATLTALGIVLNVSKYQHAR